MLTAACRLHAGQNEDGNGRVILYDEMINELCDSSGGERLEFWKFAPGGSNGAPRVAGLVR